MNWIEKIKQHFYQSALSKELQNKKTQRKIINLTDAKHIGILYDYGNKSAADQVINTLEQQSKKVESLCFYAGKEKEKPTLPNLFSRAQVRWQYVPNNELAKSFSSKKFDLLICLFTEENLPLEYIATASDSSWRVGVFSESKTQCYDMMINIGDKKEVKYLWDQIIHFLNNIQYDSK
jgi:hypothetical protein